MVALQKLTENKEKLAKLEAEYEKAAELLYHTCKINPFSVADSLESWQKARYALETRKTIVQLQTTALDYMRRFEEIARKFMAGHVHSPCEAHMNKRRCWRVDLNVCGGANDRPVVREHCVCCTEGDISNRQRPYFQLHLRRNGTFLPYEQIFNKMEAHCDLSLFHTSETAVLRLQTVCEPCVKQMWEHQVKAQEKENQENKRKFANGIYQVVCGWDKRLSMVVVDYALDFLIPACYFCKLF